MTTLTAGLGLCLLNIQDRELFSKLKSSNFKFSKFEKPQYTMCPVCVRSVSTKYTKLGLFSKLKFSNFKF
jgi:hypothetical protein